MSKKVFSSKPSSLGGAFKKICRKKKGYHASLQEILSGVKFKGDVNTSEGKLLLWSTVGSEQLVIIDDFSLDIIEIKYRDGSHMIEPRSKILCKYVQDFVTHHNLADEFEEFIQFLPECRRVCVTDNYWPGRFISRLHMSATVLSDYIIDNLKYRVEQIIVPEEFELSYKISRILADGKKIRLEEAPEVLQEMFILCDKLYRSANQSNEKGKIKFKKYYDTYE